GMDAHGGGAAEQQHADEGGIAHSPRLPDRGNRCIGHAAACRSGPEMGLSIGIVGLPNVGKSTLFNALSGASVLAANYPFATKDPNVGVVPVPDERLERLAVLYKPKKTTHAALEFVDIAGLVKGASKGRAGKSVPRQHQRGGCDRPRPALLPGSGR